MTNKGDFASAFLSYTSEILADTELGLSGPQIAKVMSKYAIEYDVDIPHPRYPFQAQNKRIALYENLTVFSSKSFTA